MGSGLGQQAYHAQFCKSRLLHLGAGRGLFEPKESRLRQTSGRQLHGSTPSSSLAPLNFLIQETATQTGRKRQEMRKTELTCEVFMGSLSSKGEPQFLWMWRQFHHLKAGCYWRLNCPSTSFLLRRRVGRSLNK